MNPGTGAAAGSTTAGLTFLSWYRTGLSAGVAAPAGGRRWTPRRPSPWSCR